MCRSLSDWLGRPFTHDNHAAVHGNMVVIRKRQHRTQTSSRKDPRPKSRGQRATGNAQSPVKPAFPKAVSPTSTRHPTAPRPALGDVNHDGVMDYQLSSSDCRPRRRLDGTPLVVHLGLGDCCRKALHAVSGKRSRSSCGLKRIELVKQRWVLTSGPSLWRANLPLRRSRLD